FPRPRAGAEIVGGIEFGGGLARRGRCTLCRRRRLGRRLVRRRRDRRAPARNGAPLRRQHGDGGAHRELQSRSGAFAGAAGAAGAVAMRTCAWFAPPPPARLASGPFNDGIAKRSLGELSSAERETEGGAPPPSSFAAHMTLPPQAGEETK